MGNLIGTICKGAKDYIDDEFVYDNQIILNKMILYLESERERKDHKLKIISDKINRKSLKKLFN